VFWIQNRVSRSPPAIAIFPLALPSDLAISIRDTCVNWPFSRTHLPVTIDQFLLSPFFGTHTEVLDAELEQMKNRFTVCRSDVHTVWDRPHLKSRHHRQTPRHRCGTRRHGSACCQRTRAAPIARGLASSSLGSTLLPSALSRSVPMSI
jgi:hypothetical protein